MFVSSTFMGMQEVRNFLCRHIFPRISEYCNDKNVLFSVVDLRWGITEEETKQGKITELCLRELDNCHPYFLGLVGKRYGTIPQEDSENFFDEYKKLFFGNNKGKSYTELEFLWNATSEGYKDFSSIFFISDISVDDYNSSESEIKEFHYRTVELYGQENVFDNISAIENLGEKIFARLKTYVDSVVGNKCYSLIECLELGNLRQAKQICKTGFKQQRYLQIIDNYIKSGGKPILIHSQEGYGKSSLLAHTYLSLLQQDKSAYIRFWANSDIFLDELFDNLHHAVDGTEPIDKEPERVKLKDGITAGFDEKVKERVNEKEVVLRSPKILTAVFAKMLESCVLTNNVVTVLIDDIDKYITSVSGNIFSYFLREIPANVRLIFTVSSDFKLSDIDRRYIGSWNILELNSLDEDSVTECAQEMLSHFGKRLSEIQIAALQRNADLFKPRNLFYCTASINLSPCYYQVEQAITRFSDTGFKFQHFYDLCDMKSANRILSVIACSEAGFNEEQLKIIFKKKKDILTNLYPVLNIFSLFLSKGKNGNVFINDPRLKRQLLSNRQETYVSRNLILNRIKAFSDNYYKQVIYEECHQLFEQRSFSKLADKVFNIKIGNILQMERQSQYKKYLISLMKYGDNYVYSLLRSLAQLRDSDFIRYGLAVMDIATCLSNCGYGKHAIYIMLIYEGECSKLFGEFSSLICATYCQLYNLAMEAGYLNFADAIICHLYHILINNTSQKDFFDKFSPWSLRSMAESIYEAGIVLGKDHYTDFAKTLLQAAKHYDGIGMSFEEPIYHSKRTEIVNNGLFDISDYDVLIGSKVCIYIPKCYIANRELKVVGKNTKLYSLKSSENPHIASYYNVLQKIIDDGLVQPQYSEVTKLIENGFILKHRECDKIGLYYKIRLLIPLRHGICFEQKENETTLLCAGEPVKLQPPQSLVWLYSDGKRSVEEIADMIYKVFQTPDFLILQKEISNSVYQLFRRNLLTIEGDKNEG